MAQSYKALKENFVSNLSGGDIWEINYVTAVAPVGTTISLGGQQLMGKCLDSLLPVGGSSVSARSLRQIRLCGDVDRLPPQRCSCPPCNNYILTLPIGTQCFTRLARPWALPSAASFEKAKTSREATHGEWKRTGSRGVP